MPLPRALARSNRVVLNWLFAPLAGRVPPWVIVEHVGRRTARRYHTVVWAFPYHGGLVVLLTYGPRSDWVRNVLAAGSCRIKWLGHWRQFGSIELVQGAPARRLLPLFLQPTFGFGGINCVLHLRA